MPAVKPKKKLTRAMYIKNSMAQWLEQHPKATTKERYEAFDQIVDELDETTDQFIEKELTTRQ